MSLFSTFLLTCAALSAAVGQILFKFGADNRETLWEFFNWQIILGLCFYGIGTIIWIYTLSHEKLVDVYAFTALTFVLVYLGGVFLLSEPLGFLEGAGVVLVLFGLFLITRSGNLA